MWDRNENIRPLALWRIVLKKSTKVFALVVALILTSAAHAQSTFEVATIKPAAPLDQAKIAAAMQAGEAPKIGPRVEGSRAEYTYMALRDLIAFAYNIKPYQVSGPDWLATTRFDIEAKMPEGTTKNDAPAMMQALLKERFKLVAHPAAEEQSVLALVVAKNGPKLKEAAEAPTPIDENTPMKPGEVKMDTLDGPMRIKINPDGSTVFNMGAKGTFTQKMDMQTKTMEIRSNDIAMAGFADMLTRVMQMGGTSSRQVIDQTGLKGYYAVNLDISLAELQAIIRASGMNMQAASGGESSDDPQSGQTVLESVQALGLRLESRKANVDRLVIDNVSKTPTEN
jgi:uncharacterized protein (TIGR03435 family)